MIPLTLFNENKNERITAIGELLVEFIPNDEKVLLDGPGKLIKTLSGSSGIFASAASNLGRKSGLIALLGEDMFSKFALTVLKDDGVDISNICLSDKGQIGLSFLEYRDDKRTYEFYRENSVGSKLNEKHIDESYIKESASIHYPGMILELNQNIREACMKAVNIARKNDVLVSFDPNIRMEMVKLDESMERVKWAISNADIISPTIEEARFITGKNEVKKIIEEFHKMGPKFVAITMDKHGTILSCGNEIMRFHGVEVDAIDPTGAGDSFAAALMTGILNGWELKYIGQFCNSVGAMVTTKRGTIKKAIPTLEEVKDFMKKNPMNIEVIN